MEQQTIKFTIRQDGYVTEEVIGATSSECVKITQSVDDYLGELKTRQYKPEYYNNVTLHHNQHETQEQTTTAGSTGDSSV